MAVPDMSGYLRNFQQNPRDLVGNSGVQEANAIANGPLAQLGAMLMTSAMDDWKSKKIEERQIAREGRAEGRQIAKEGRVLGMAEDERAREEALYADPTSRESRGLALEEEKVRSQIERNNAASSSSRASAARQGQRSSGRTPAKFSELDKQKLKDIRERQKDFEPGSKEDQVLESQKRSIYLKYDPEQQAKIARRRELMAKMESAPVEQPAPALAPAPAPAPEPVPAPEPIAPGRGRRNTQSKRRSYLEEAGNKIYEVLKPTGKNNKRGRSNRGR